MTLRVGINGFGRIGRNTLRTAWSRDDVDFVHINDLTSPDMLVYLLQYDTVHGRFDAEVAQSGDGLTVNGQYIGVTAERDPSKLPWGDLGVDVVLECTGVFLDAHKARAHIDAGARKVVISAPGKNVDGTFVCGVNDHLIDPSTHTIVSNASCTTNCLAPLAKVLHGAIGIEYAMMTTVHSYTMDQNLLDAQHRKGKMRRARAAALNMVPTTTGAAKAVGLVLPELSGRIAGMAIRVPTPDVSLVDLVFQASRPTTVDEVNKVLCEAASGPLAGVLAVSDAPLVSSDLVGNPHSSIIDLPSTTVIGGSMVKVLSWYDNEWGFSNRMLDLAIRLGART
jgi:glyceraldehyde 3-phosphate dehydrogenase